MADTDVIIGVAESSALETANACSSFLLEATLPAAEANALIFVRECFYDSVVGGSRREQVVGSIMSQTKLVYNPP